MTTPDPKPGSADRRQSDALGKMVEHHLPHLDDREGERRAEPGTAALTEGVRDVGDTRFEGWLSEHETDATGFGSRLPMYHKQDMRDAYWAGYTERAHPAAAAGVTVGEALDEFTEWVDQWAQAYPEDVFPKPDLDKVRRVLEAEGMTIDSVSADAMRHVITKVKDRWVDSLRALAAGVPSAERVKRLQDAIEGECDGLAVDDAHARAILDYLDTGEAPGAALSHPSTDR